MNSQFVMGTLAAGFVVAATLGASAPVMAATVSTVGNHSGTICKNYNAADASVIDYLTSGARASKAGNVSLICPLVRSTQGTGGATAYVDVTHSTSGTTTCTLYSVSSAGTYLATNTLSWTGVGFHEFALSVAGVNKSTAWSDYAVLCNIPGSYNGVIMGVDLNEL